MSFNWSMQSLVILKNFFSLARMRGDGDHEAETGLIRVVVGNLN